MFTLEGFLAGNGFLFGKIFQKTNFWPNKGTENIKNYDVGLQSFVHLACLYKVYSVNDVCFNECESHPIYSLSLRTLHWLLLKCVKRSPSPVGTC